MGHGHMRTKAQAITRQVHMAIEAFHSDHGEFPKDLKELEGNNSRKKVYFRGIEETVADNEISYEFDHDNDGYVDTDAGKVKQKIAVWIHLGPENIIKSWDD